MSVSNIQVLKVLLHQSSTQTSVTHALNSAASAGQFIIFGGFVDKATTITAPGGSGWTVDIAQSNTNLSYFLFTKYAAGGEQNLVANFGDSTNNLCKTFSYVYSADAAVDVFSHFYSTSTVRSITAAITAALAANPHTAFAFIGTDSTGSISTGTDHTIDNDYSLTLQNYTESSPAGIPALAVAEKTSLFDTAGEQCTFSYTGGGVDEMGIMLLVIRDTNPGAVSGKSNHYFRQLNG